MSEKFRIGIVGAGRGRSYFSPFAAMAETEVIAICDLDQSALDQIGNQYQIKQRFTNYDDLLDQVDIVVLATPENLHVPQSVQALQAGKHVISEVTAAVSLDQCTELVQAVESSSAQYMMAENLCYQKSNILIRNMVQQGVFGDIYFGEGEYVHDIKSLHHDGQGNPTWRYYWQVGINRCNYATHSLGPVLDWFGERVKSVCSLGTGVHTDPEHAMEDTVLMLCKTESDYLIKIRIDMLSTRPANSYFSLQGTKACYEGTRGFGDQPKISIAGEAWQPFSNFESEFLPDRWTKPSAEAQAAGVTGEYFELRDFIDALLNGTPPPLNVYRALDFTVPGLVSEESIANGGTPVAVPDFREGLAEKCQAGK